MALFLTFLFCYNEPKYKIKTMSSERDLKLIEAQPPVKLWGEDLDEIEEHKVYKGKFVETEGGKIFAKLFPKSDWDNIEFFHDMLVKELGVKDVPGNQESQIAVCAGLVRHAPGESPRRIVQRHHVHR